MACPKCQCETVAAANFCHRCGTMVRPFCIPCRLELPPDSHFCFRCGQGVGETTAVISRNVEAKPVRNLPPAAGERKWVTVVFADLSGFTAMSEKLDPERVTEIVNQCFKRLGKIVFDLEGHIDKFMGDCIMALFGAPIAHENDPELAVDCALQMLDELQKINQENGLDLGISIGMNSGLVVAGAVGADQKTDYTVMGDAVNTAQRLQSAAKRGEIFVSASVYRAASKRFDFKELEPIKLKGKEQAVAVYSVKGRRHLDETIKSQDSKVPPLIGREMELQIVDRSFTEAERARGQILFLSGDPGIGKSRLKLEMRQRAQARNFLWMETKCTNLHRETPYYAWTELIKRILENETSKDFSTFGLDRLGSTILRDHMNLVLPEDEPLKIDGAQRKILLANAIRNVILAIAKRKTTAIYFEDVHWMDPLSRDVLTLTLQSVPTHPLILSAGSRPDFVHDWAKMKNFTRLSLAPLTTDQSMSLVKFVLSTDREPEGLRELIEKKCDGNPLFIEEIIKNLVDSKRLVKEGDSWRTSGEIAVDDIPATIQGLIASRIDRLSEADKYILQIASVIGRKFSERLIQFIVKDLGSIQSSLEELRRRDLIFEGVREGNDVSYVFHHALMQDVAYQSILSKNRKIFHAQVAAAIEDLIGIDKSIDPAEWYDPLGYHFIEAGDHEKAIFYLFKSGNRLKETYQNDGAIRAFKSVIEMAQKHESSSNEKFFVEATGELSDVYLLVGKSEEGEVLQNSLIHHAQRTGDDRLLTNAHRKLGEINRKRGNFEAALKDFTTALDLSMRASDFETQVKVWKGLANTYKDLHNEKKALEILAQGLAAARALNKPRLIAEYLNDMATVYLDQNNYTDAGAKLLESIEFSSKDPNLKSLYASSTINLGLTHQLRGDLQNALTRYREGAKLAEEIGDLKNIVIAKNNMAEVLLEFDRFEDALTEVEKTTQICKDSGNQWQLISASIFKGYALARLGRISEGEALLEAMVEDAAEKKFWHFYCDAVFYLARLASMRGDWGDAEGFLKSALAKMNSIKNQGLIDRANAELKKLLTQKPSAFKST